MGQHTLLSRREESASAPLQSQQTVVSDYVVLGWKSGKQRQGEQPSRSFSANGQGSGQPDTQETWSLKRQVWSLAGDKAQPAVKNR